MSCFTAIFEVENGLWYPLFIPALDITSMEPQQSTETPTTSPTPAPEVVATTVPTPAPTRRIPKHYLAFVGGLILALAIGYFFFIRTAADVAAVVNGTKITAAEVAESADMMTKSAELQGMDVSDPVVLEQIRAQALENLINNELLMGAARQSGVTANEASIQSAYDELVTQVGGEEELQTRMATVGLTTDTLMGNITDRLIVDQYIESSTDIETITVTDEEIQTYLNSIVTDGVELPPLEEIKPQIEATLLAEKQQTLVNDLIEKLRSEAKIEIRN